MTPPDPYGDPRLAELYDGDNPAGPDHDFLRATADRLDARTVLDLGCGTGILTVTLARPGRTVVGIDPSATMLDLARRRPGGDRVTWVHGDAAAFPEGPADLVLMSGNVAQHVTEPDWPGVLRRIACVLRPGGLLAFDSRNPQVRVWEDWAAAGASTRVTRHGPLTERIEVDAVSGPPDARVVVLRFANRFDRTQERSDAVMTLTFRSRERLEADLAAAGFSRSTVSGGWAGEAARPDSPLLVVTATR